MHACPSNAPLTVQRPDIVAPTLRIASINNSTVAPGYMFITPNNPAGANFNTAMYMYNNAGRLVWSGQKFSNPDYSLNNFYVCQYQNQPHLCVTLFRGPVGGGTAQSSYNLIIDSTYTVVRAVAPSAQYNGATLTQDLHEFNVILPGISAVGTSYATVQHPVTLPACGGVTPQYIKTGLFTDTTLDGLNTTLFQWNALDHVNVTDSYVCPGQPMVGSGNSSTDGFDFFHINAVDKDAAGDYIVSSRHTSTIYKIAGLTSPSGQASGSVIWRLGGKSNTFTNINSHVGNSGHFNFSFQHHARFRNGGIHLWDNANDAITPASGASSSGMGIDIDEQSNTATLVYQAVPPDGALDSSQGSHQVLPNGNHFCGMGSVNELYERTHSGALALDVFFSQPPAQSYRAFKFPWTGRPAASELRIFTYAHTCTAGPAFYVSWNGATTVTGYRVFASNSSSGPFQQVATQAKGVEFETVITRPTFAAYSYAQALDANNNVLGTTPHVQTFVPGGTLTAQCNNFQCPAGTNYTTAPRTTCPS
jgi:Arylsulfotransferase (ASST)